VHAESEHEKKDWEAERRNGRIMKVYKKVSIRNLWDGHEVDECVANCQTIFP